MNRKMFLERLKEELILLSKSEREEILSDYEEHFDLGKEAGKTEEEVAASLGAPDQIAKEILGNYQINTEILESNVKKKSGTNVLRMLLITFMLTFINLFFVIWIFISIALLIFAAWLMIGTLVVAPILFVINAVMNPAAFNWFDFFLSLMMCSGGYFLGLFMWIITKLGVKFSVWYAKFNVKLMKGE